MSNYYEPDHWRSGIYIRIRRRVAHVRTVSRLGSGWCARTHKPVSQAVNQDLNNHDAEWWGHYYCILLSSFKDRSIMKLLAIAVALVSALGTTAAISPTDPAYASSVLAIQDTINRYPLAIDSKVACYELQCRLLSTWANSLEEFHSTSRHLHHRRSRELLCPTWRLNRYSCYSKHSKQEFGASDNPAWAQHPNR